VCPVESGYRWVLTYNLALNPNAVRPLAGLVRSETKALRHTLRKWLQEPEESRQNGLYYVLDHNYTEASIKLNSMKTRDLALGQVLNNVSKELDFEVFFALLEKQEFGETEFDHDEYDKGSRYRGWGEDSEQEEEEEESYHHLAETLDLKYQVKTVREMHGRPVVDSLPLDAGNDILQDAEELFNGADPEESYEGYMGNSGPSARHWYRITQWLKESTSDSDFDDIMEQGLTYVVEAYPFLPEQLAALTNLTPKPEEAGWSASLRHKISTWADDKLKNCLDDSFKEQELGSNDGKTMIEMALIAPDPSRFLTARTIAKRFLASTDFSKAKSEGGIKLQHGNKRQRTSYHGGNANPTTEQLRATIAFDELVNFYDTLVKISTPDDDLATKFITKLTDAVPCLPVDHMHELWLHFLCYLIPVLTANAILLTTPVYQSLYRSMLTRYIKKFVGKQPV
ncbi:hypothetical protein N0V85_009499, partial [Neurospora sp. IMI 360204]